MAPRRVYLDNTPVPEARERWFAALDPDARERRTETLPAVEAVGRVLARPAVARISYPHYHAAAVDGYAVRAEDTCGASEHTPVWLERPQDAEPVDTGAPLPEGRDAVVMIEQIREQEEGIFVLGALAPWAHVRVLGEDVISGEVVLPAGATLRVVDLAALLAAGITELTLWARPRVALVSTGDELVPVGTDPQPGQVVEFNSAVLAALVEEWGGLPLVAPPVPDRMEDLEEALERALHQAEVVVINAGSSAGRKDYTASLLERSGQLVIHGVGIRPGKPTVLGKVRGQPVLGLPGYPVSAIMAARLFLRPLLERLQRLPPRTDAAVEAKMARPLVSPLGSEEHVRVNVARVGESLLAVPLGRGAAATRSLARADGLVVVPPNNEGLEAGERVNVQLLRPWREIAGNLLVTGSHDLTLDLLAGEIRALDPLVSLVAVSVGSLGGLAALKRSEAHIAGIHLLDPQSGDYNVSYVQRYLPGQPVALLTLAYREQGLILPRGNPRAVKSLADLGAPDLRFLNRQRGSGTRILLDYMLQKQGLEPKAIPGYGQEVFTHMEVAAAVASGAADAGLGIFAAARALDLEFVPVTEERYELAVPEAHWETPGVQALRRAVASPGFLRQVQELGGYNLDQSGAVRRVDAGSSGPDADPGEG